MRERVGRESKFKNLIKFPKLGGRWTNTGEGGLDIYAVILQPDQQIERFSKCLAGSPSWGSMDAVLAPDKFKLLNYELNKSADIEYIPQKSCNVAILIGTTNTCFWDGNFYYIGKMDDLTEDGKALFEILKKTYGVYPDIVTLLDT